MRDVQVLRLKSGVVGSPTVKSSGIGADKYFLVAEYDPPPKIFSVITRQNNKLNNVFFNQNKCIVN